MDFANSGITIDINGRPVLPGTPETFLSRIPLTVTISKNGSPFKGFLGIAGSDTLVDTTDLISLVDGDTGLQISGPCADEDVSIG